MENGSMTEQGFIALARGVFDHPIVGAQKPYSKFEAWAWLIFEAAWKARRYDAGGFTVPLERGQVAHSIRYMAEAWGWHRSSVERFLTRLKTDTMIETQSETGLTVITLCKYEEYQNPNGRSETASATGTETAPRQQRDRKEPTKPIKKDIALCERVSDEWNFDVWYSIYPRKKSRKDAERSFSKVKRSGEIAFSVLIERTRALAAVWSARVAAKSKSEIDFCPYPASWLNAGSYLDEPDNGKPGGGVPMPSRSPDTFTEQDWQKRIAMHARGDAWPVTQWGPAPGSPGCLVPARLLVQPVPGSIELTTKTAGSGAA